jgi:hypothetical protein
MAARKSVAAITIFTRVRSTGRCQRAHHQRVLIERIVMPVFLAANARPDKRFCQRAYAAANR